MQVTQEFYDDSIYKSRKSQYNVSIGLFDTTARDDATITSTESIMSFPQQLVDRILVSQPIGTGELNQFLLDGSMRLPVNGQTLNPVFTDADDIGWWSVLADAAGE